MSGWNNLHYSSTIVNSETRYLDEPVLVYQRRLVNFDVYSPVCLWVLPSRRQQQLRAVALLTLCPPCTTQQRQHHRTHVSIEDVGLIWPTGQVIGCKKVEPDSNRTQRNQDTLEHIRIPKYTFKNDTITFKCLLLSVLLTDSVKFLTLNKLRLSECTLNSTWSQK